MDRTAFRIQTFEEADNHAAYWPARPVAHRLMAAKELIDRAADLFSPHRQCVN